VAASFAVALFVAVLRPTPEVPITTFGASARFWQLPTGSQIAYYDYDPPADVSLKPEPILFLHGGPGFAISPFERSFFKQFAADGYRVYLFDQAGSGQSAFLAPRQYTVSRFVEDIEAIRQQIGAERLVLVGHSWGSTLAASYIAKYPEHAAKVVLYSPGPIWNWTNYDFDLSHTAEAPFKGTLPFRLWAALFLAQNRDNPVAGEKLVSLRESETLYLRWVAPGNNTPAIILFSECDFIPWASSLDYRKTFAKARVYYISRAGHIIEFAQPELLARIIRAFLLDKPDVIRPYVGDDDLRKAQPD
jgi:proline iminopeptidase